MDVHIVRCSLLSDVTMTMSHVYNVLLTFYFPFCGDFIAVCSWCVNHRPRYFLKSLYYFPYFTFFNGVGSIYTCKYNTYPHDLCDELQQNRDQVSHAYFELWTIEVGIGVKNNSSVDCENFFTYLGTFSITAM